MRLASSSSVISECCTPQEGCSTPRSLARKSGSATEPPSALQGDERLLAVERDRAVEVADRQDDDLEAPVLRAGHFSARRASEAPRRSSWELRVGPQRSRREDPGREAIRVSWVVLTRLSSKQVERLVDIARSVPLGPPRRLAPSARQRRLSDAARQSVVDAYQRGESMAALARLHEVRRETISKVIRDAGVLVRTQRAIDQEQIGEAGELYRKGWSLARLAERFGFDGQTIHTHLKRAGVVMRGPHDWRDLT